MTVRIVDPLEVVDVHHGPYLGKLSASGPKVQRLRTTLESAAVVQPGEGIRQGSVDQLLGIDVLDTDIANDGNIAAGGFVGIDYRCNHTVAPHFLTVAFLPRGIDSTPTHLVNHLPDVDEVGGGRCRLAQIHGNSLQQRLAHDGIGSDAEKPSDGRIPLDHRSGVVEHGDAVAVDVFEHQPHAAALALEFAFLLHHDGHIV